MSDWDKMIDEWDTDGNLTPLALALAALQDYGCDCGDNEPGTCLPCLCETALHDLWEQVREIRSEREARMRAETNVDGYRRLCADMEDEIGRLRETLRCVVGCQWRSTSEADNPEFCCQCGCSDNNKVCVVDGEPFPGAGEEE